MITKSVNVDNTLEFFDEVKRMCDNNRSCATCPIHNEIKPCMDCGAMMIYVDANTKYCDKCRALRRQESEKNTIRKSTLLRRMTNQKRVCKECGADISDRAGNAIYCRDCASMKNTLAAEKRAREMAKKPKVKKVQDKPIKNLNRCIGCVHREYMSGLDCHACCYYVNTGKERPMPPSECYKHENTPYRRVRG